MELIIGNKNYSSWSLRAWLLLAANDLLFEETRIPLFEATMDAAIREHSDAAKVPVLHDGDLTVWDSLAICEYISEQYLDGKGWPAAAAARAEARSCCSEMHSGFFAIRERMPMNCRAVGRRVEIPPELQAEISRVDALWSEMRLKYAPTGPWLFGQFSIGDCMFAPVVFRFATYGVAVSEVTGAYMKTLLGHPKVQLWLEHSKREVETIEEEEVGR